METIYEFGDLEFTLEDAAIKAISVFIGACATACTASVVGKGSGNAVIKTLGAAGVGLAVGKLAQNATEATVYDSILFGKIAARKTVEILGGRIEEKKEVNGTESEDKE